MRIELTITYGGVGVKIGFILFITIPFYLFIGIVNIPSLTSHDLNQQKQKQIQIPLPQQVWQ
jgi:hypothetical protein